MDTLTKLQTIRDFEKWATARKIDADLLALLEFLDQTKFINGPGDKTILFVCDKKRCESCSTGGACEHTTDIKHAVNFELENNIYIEREYSQPSIIKQVTNRSAGLAAALAGLGGPVTNYDKIKRMSEDELAAFLEKISTRCMNAGNSPGFRLCDDCPIVDDEDTCNFAGWLKKEVDK